MNWSGKPGSRQSSFITLSPGQTHYLDELAAWILRKVIVAPISTSDLYAKMAGVYGVEITEELRESTDQTLETLENLGLIVSPSANC